MANLYRKSSLDKLSNPDQLDKMVKISSPLSWLVLISVFLVIVATIIWSFCGTLPITETVSGMVVSSKNINAVYSKWTGTVEKFHKEIGKDIKKGDKLVDIKLSDGTIKTINADCDAFLDIFTIEVGMFIVEGTEIARMTPKDLPSQVIVCYVPLSSAQKFAKGMKVLIYPTAIDSQKYGHMEAEIVSIEPYATNTESLFYMLGSGNMVAEQFASNGPIVSVVCKIKNDNSTKSGYYWSSDKAQNIVVSNGNVISAKIVTEECAPITKLIGDFKDIMEG